MIDNLIQRDGACYDVVVQFRCAMQIKASILSNSSKKRNWIIFLLDFIQSKDLT